MSKNKHWLVPDWPAPANIHAATTLRTGGVSQAPYFSLNPAAHVRDAAEQVRQNRQIIREMLDLPSEPVWLDQIHSNRAVKAANPPYPPREIREIGRFGFQPQRGTAFDLLDHGRRLASARQRAEQMHMVLHAADNDGLAFQIRQDAAEVTVQFVTQWVVAKEWPAVFGGEDRVHQNLCE